MKGLNCLLENGNQIQLIGAAMRDIANTMITANPDAKITVGKIYRELKDFGIDIDQESTAYIYADEFSQEVNKYSNYHTPEELLEFAKKYPPVSKDVKAALIGAGFSKKAKDGTNILDWTKLMRKSEDEIKAEIRKAGLANETEILDALQNEWKQIVSTAIIKAKNFLTARDKDITASQRNAIDRVADLHVRGLFHEFKDDYKNAIHKAIGTSRETLSDLKELDELAKTARLLQESPFGTNNVLAQQLQHQINKIISKARFRDAKGFGGYIYKTVKIVSNIYEMANLALLNNIGNRAQNFASGYAERTFSAMQYGRVANSRFEALKRFDKNTELSVLATQTAKDSTLNGGVDFGDVNNMFYGDRAASEKVQEFLSSGFKNKTYEQWFNWTYGLLMGTSALNGIDNSMKVKNTWTRFISGMEDILVSAELEKGVDQKTAKKAIKEKLNLELFGQKWEDARKVAESTMQEIKRKGGTINITPQSIERFTADVVKAQLVSNEIITREQLDAAWDAGYKSAGRAMGHVPNNILTNALNTVKESIVSGLEKSLSDGKYGKAGFLLLTDLLVNKVIYRFAGGGTNWLVLKLEKGGLGLFSGLVGRVRDNSDFENKKHLSEMKGTDIEESLYNIQKSNDKYASGSVGLVVNALLLILVKQLCTPDDNDDDEERRRKNARRKELVKWMDNNRWSNKYVNNLVPWYLTAYIAWERQKSAKGGIKAMSNTYKYSPGRAYAYNFMNMQEASTTDKVVAAAGGIFSNKEQKREEAKGELGIVLGNMFNVNPLPLRPFKDAYTLIQGLQGDIEETYVKPKGLWEGYLKFGQFDWPKLEEEKKSSPAPASAPAVPEMQSAFDKPNF